MADDIDIEEHDVMDNPAIKSMFPDLSVVKHEIMDYDEGSKEKHRSTTIKKSAMVHPDSTTDVSEVFNHQGTKMKTSPVSSTQNNLDVTNAGYHRDNQDSLDNVPKDVIKDTKTFEVLKTFDNKLILGLKSKTKNKVITKPYLDLSRTSVPKLSKETTAYDKLDDAEKRKCVSVKVTLKNCVSLLNKSECYCISCSILFPTTDEFDQHVSSTHNDNEPAESVFNSDNEAVMTKDIEMVTQPLPQSKNVDTPSIAKAQKDPVADCKSNNYCSHCKESFPTKQAVIDHLYEILNPKLDMINKKKYKNNQPEKVIVEKEDKNRLFPTDDGDSNIQTLVIKESDEQADRTIASFENKALKRIASFREDTKINQSRKKFKRASPTLLRYCGTCRCCLSINHSLNLAYHRNKECVRVNSAICKQCGLRFTTSCLVSHRAFHDKHKELTLLDFKIFNLHNDKRIIPPIPTFSYCGNCNTYYTFPKRFQIHDCKTSRRRTCTECDIDLNPLAYKLHVAFHEYAKRNKVLTEPVVNTTQSASTKNTYTLYQCSECDAMVNKAKVRAHRNEYDCNTMKDLYKVCSYCNYAIVGKDYTDHMNRHESESNFNKDNIIVIPFLKKKIDGESESETESEVEAVANELKVEYIFYQCKQCKVCVKSHRTARLHVCAMKCHVKRCKICHLLFINAYMLKHQNEHEGDPDFIRANMKIIQFDRNPKKNRHSLQKAESSETTDESDQDFISDTSSGGKCKKVKVDPAHPKATRPERQAKINISKVIHKIDSAKDIESISDETSNSKHSDINSEVDSTDRISLYQCIKCKLSYYDDGVVLDHICQKTTPYKCLLCNFNFERQAYIKHLKLHSLNKKFNQELVDVIPFGFEAPLDVTDTKEDATIENESEEALDNDIGDKIEIYKCSCGLHFLTRDDIDVHQKICSPTSLVSKQECSKCGLLFTADVLFTHLMTQQCKEKKENYKVVLYV